MGLNAESEHPDDCKSSLQKESMIPGDRSETFKTADWLQVYHSSDVSTWLIPSHLSLPFSYPPPHWLTFRKWASSNLSRFVCDWRDLNNQFMPPMLCRTPLQIIKWSSSQSPGALTANVSKNFSATTSRMLSPMLLSIESNVWLVAWHVHRAFSTSRLDEREDGDAIQQYLYEKTGQRTVPNVFVSEYTMPTSY